MEAGWMLGVVGIFTLALVLAGAWLRGEQRRQPVVEIDEEQFRVAVARMLEEGRDR